MINPGAGCRATPFGGSKGSAQMDKAGSPKPIALGIPRLIKETFVPSG